LSQPLAEATIQGGLLMEFEFIDTLLTQVFEGLTEILSGQILEIVQVIFDNIFG
jgi:hypothetical protein